MNPIFFKEVFLGDTAHKKCDAFQFNCICNHINSLNAFLGLFDDTCYKVPQAS